jgi:hypothetical protein
MGTYGVKRKVVLPWLVHWARRAGTKDFYSALDALVSPLQNIFFLTPHTFSFYVSSSLSNLGRPVVPGRLSLNMYLWKNAQRARNKNIL